MSSLDKELASSFGADRESVTVNSEGISGSAIAQIAAKQEVFVPESLFLCVINASLVVSDQRR